MSGMTEQKCRHGQISGMIVVSSVGHHSYLELLPEVGFEVIDDSRYGIAIALVRMSWR